MTLRKRQVPLTFIGGMDTSKQESIPVEIVEAVNLRYTKIGGLTKRGGYKDLPPLEGVENLFGGITPTSLLASTATKLHSYFPKTDAWETLDDLILRNTEASSFVGDISKTLSKCCTISNNSLILYVWEDSTSTTIQCSLLDKETNTPIGGVHRFTLTSTGKNVKVYNFNSRLYIFWVDTSNNSLMSVYTEDAIDTIKNIPVKVIDGSLNASGLYDINSHPTRFLPIFYVNTAGKVVACYRDPISGAIPVEDDRLPEEVTFDIEPLTLFKVGLEAGVRRLFCIIYDSSEDTLGAYTVTGRFVPWSENASAISYTNDLKAVSISESAETLHIVTSHINETVHYSALDMSNTTAILPDPIILLRRTSLVSEIYSINTSNNNRDDVLEFLVGFNSEFQSTYFNVSLTLDEGNKRPLITGKILPKLAKSTMIDSYLHTLDNSDDGDVIGLLPVITRAIRNNEGDLVYDFGLSAVKILAPFNTAILPSNIQPQSGTMYISSSIIQTYDGYKVVEAGFNVAPEELSVNFDGVTGDVAEGTYYYYAVYSYVDAHGRIYRSAPSFALKVEVPSGGRDVEIFAPSLALTNKVGVIVEYYRTENLGTVPYLIGTAPNDTTTDNWTMFIDTSPDSSIITNELLYTTGRVLQNDAPPSAEIITSFQNRVFVSNTSLGQFLYYSKPVDDTKAVEFSEFLTVNIPHKGGRVTALRTLGDFLLVLREASIGVIRGTGANVLGQNAKYEYDVVSEDVGCVDYNSVVAFGRGFIFKSTKGFQLMDLSGSLEYVGMPVVGLESKISVTSATQKGLELWFSYVNNDLPLKDRGILVYNTIFEAWTTFSIPAHQLLPIGGWGLLYNNDSSLSVIEYDEKIKRDGSGIPILIKLVTGWLNFSEIRGYQRVYEIGILGHVTQSCRLKATISYDGRRDLNETICKDANYASVYGTEYEDFFGQTAPFGDNHSSRLVSFSPKKQRCDAVSITFEEIDTSPSEGFEITTMILNVGTKRGMAKPQTENYKGNRQ